MSIHNTQSRLQALFSGKVILPVLLISLLSCSTSYAQGIAPGGCVTGGSTFPGDDFGSSASNFGAFSRRNSVASKKTQQLRAAFVQVGSEMDNSLSEGNLVSGFRQYLNYAKKAQEYQKELPEISTAFTLTRNRITVVLNYAVNNAKRVTDKSPEDEIALMTLVEIANMPEIAAPSLNAQQHLMKLKDTETYRKTLAEFKKKYQIQSLAPEVPSVSAGKMQEAAKILKR